MDVKTQEHKPRYDIGKVMVFFQGPDVSSFVAFYKFSIFLNLQIISNDVIKKCIVAQKINIFDKQIFSD